MFGKRNAFGISLFNVTRYNQVKHHLVICVVGVSCFSITEASLEVKICLTLFLTRLGKAWVTTMSWAGRTGPTTVKGAMGRTG